LPGSTYALDNLLMFLRLNPSYTIEVGGHINAPSSIKVTPASYSFKLSTDRAQAVVTYLSEHGIASSRMKAVGYGNWKMVYPDPITEKQQTANRRVEIKVLSK
jgi:outer membrane protein OmpA-like peptidoglycan-associated protein